MFSVSPSSRAITLFGRPSSTSASTEPWRGVRPSSAGVTGMLCVGPNARGWPFKASSDGKAVSPASTRRTTAAKAGASRCFPTKPNADSARARSTISGVASADMKMKRAAGTIDLSVCMASKPVPSFSQMSSSTISGRSPRWRVFSASEALPAAWTATSGITCARNRVVPDSAMGWSSTTSKVGATFDMRFPV